MKAILVQIVAYAPLAIRIVERAIGWAGLPEDLRTWATLVQYIREGMSMYDWAIFALALSGLTIVLAWDALAELRIPWFDEKIKLSDVRGLAIRKRLLTGDHNADANPAYEIEKQLTQYAADGHSFWGRPCRTPLGGSPLVKIPQPHFVDDGFEIGHGSIHYEVKNKTSLTVRGFQRHQLDGSGYCDIHLMKSTALKAIDEVKKAARQSRSSRRNTEA